MKRRFLIHLALLLIAAMLLSTPVMAEDLTSVTAVEPAEEIYNLEEAPQPEELPEFQLGDPGSDDTNNTDVAVEAAEMTAPADNDIPKAAAPTKLTLGVKETYALKITGVKKYETSDKTVATVTKKGIITAKKTGKATITATDKNGKKTKVKLTVKKAPDTVTLSKTKATLKVGKTLQLKAKLPTGTASNKMTWTSSNKRVATVSATGKVTTVKAGTVTITAKTFNGKKATCKIKVKKAAVKPTVKPTPEPTEEPTPEPTPVPTPTPVPISVNANSLTISENESSSVSITYLGYNTITWDSSNDDVATCKWSNKWNGGTTLLAIIGKKAGNATITVSDEETNDSVQIDVTVLPSIVVQLPDVPIALKEYAYHSTTDVLQEFKVTKISYDYERGYSGNYYIHLYIAGEKTYDRNGSGQSSSAAIGWKLYDENNAVVDSGTAFGPGVSMGELWLGESCKSTIILTKPGTYSLSVLSSN